MNFFTKNPKKKKKKTERCWGVGVVSEFFLQRNQVYTFFFWGGGGMEEVVWRGGSVARVSELFLHRIQVSSS